MRTLIIAAFLMAICGPAAAEYSFCNKTSYAVSSAIGFVDGDRMATRGWWRLRPGECKVVLTDQIKPGRYFVYAESIPGHRGAVRTWSGDTQLCVEEQGFFTLRDQDACREDARKRRPFFAVEVTPDSEGAWRTEFSEAANYTVYSAEIAGTQRLLKDLGYDVGRIDGDLGDDTRRAMHAFERKAGLEIKNTVDDSLIDALVESANEQERKLGLFYCNDAQAPVWASVAEPLDQGAYRARGWWRIDAGECVKVLKGPLASDHYYIYAELEADNRERPLLGGDLALCVNDVTYDLTNHANCESGGLETAPFRRLDIGDANSWTYRFAADAFGDAKAKAKPPAVTAPPPVEAPADDPAASGDSDFGSGDEVPAETPGQ